MTPYNPAASIVDVWIPIINPAIKTVTHTKLEYVPYVLEHIQWQILERDMLSTALENYFNIFYLLPKILIWTNPEIIYPKMLKTGVRDLRSICFDSTIAFLQYKWKTIIKATLMAPGGMK